MLKKSTILIIAIICSLVSCSNNKDERIDVSLLSRPYSLMDLDLKPQNVFHEDCDLLLAEFENLTPLNTIAQKNNLGCWGLRCEIIGDYFTTPRMKGVYARVSSNLYKVEHDIRNFEYDDTVHTLGEIEAIQNFNSIDLNHVFELMNRLDVKWLSHKNNIIELSSYVPPSDFSLDYYNGYLYCKEGILPQASKDDYAVIIPLDHAWFYFVRCTKLIINN